MKKKWIKSIAATTLSAITVFSSVGMALAEDGIVTDKPEISLAFENEVEKKTIADEDAKIINEVFGYDWSNNNVIVCKEDTSAVIDWDNSVYEYEDVYYTAVLCPSLSRDENGNLVIEQEQETERVWVEYVDENGNTYGKWEEEKKENWIVKWNYKGGAGWYGSKEMLYAGGEGSFFDVRDEQYYYDDEYSESINNNMGTTSFLYHSETTDSNGSIKLEMNRYSVEDVYIVRISYTTDGKENYYAGDTDNRTMRYVDYWILPEGVSTVLNFETEESSDNVEAEDYVLDLTTSSTPVTTEVFNTLLEENKTKDIVINSNNGVSFTFKKNTMQSVDGKESYDFSTSFVDSYSAEMPDYITSSNFVKQINFNYSGKLPAEASIRFFVGTDYAGKTLYYSLMNEDKTFAEVQTVTVDGEGYMTVKQDHCSSYVVTTEEPKVVEQKEDTPENTPESAPENTPEGAPENTPESEPESTQAATVPSEKENATSPQTGDSSMFGMYIVLCIGAVSVLLGITRKYKKA